MTREKLEAQLADIERQLMIDAPVKMVYLEIFHAAAWERCGKDADMARCAIHELIDRELDQLAMILSVKRLLSEIKV